MIGIGAGAFALGLVFGIRISRGNREDESGHFAETIQLWRDVVSKLDETTRRNVVELGSIRERLTDLRCSISNSRISDSLNKLLDDSGRIEQEINKLRLTVHESPSPDREHCTAGTHVNTPQINTPQITTPQITHVEPAIEQSKKFEGSISTVLSFLTNGRHQEMQLKDVLNCVYGGLLEFVPFQRMGYAAIDYNADRVTAIWSRSERPVRLRAGYSAALSKSSLQFVAKQGRSRVLSDIPAYFRRHPNSHSTRLLVDEGFQSSVTCPVIAKATVVGFLFFSSVMVDGFDREHVTLAQETANQIGQAVLSTAQVAVTVQ